MKCKSTLLFFILLIFLNTSGQQGFDLRKTMGKVFINDTEYLEFINDSTLYSSINSYTDTAIFFFRNDSLFIKQSYRQTDRTGTKSILKIYDYRIAKLVDDTLELATEKNRIVLIDIDKLKKSVTSFKYLKLKISSPWEGNRQVNIDSKGNVFFSFKPIPYSINNPGGDSTAKSKTLYGKLTTNEFEIFKKILSKALASKLLTKRNCPIDGTVSTFEIATGNNIYKSSGCDLTWTQIFLLNYLYDIDNNKGLQRSRN